MNARFGLRRCLVALLAALAFAGAGWSLAQQSETTGNVAVLGWIDGPIGPATVRHVEKLIDKTRERDAAVLVLRIDTPGGLAVSMRKVISAILESPVPVIGYVAPPGAHAASAGTYILYATHVAAMAPGTNLGAATPVQIGGGFPGMPSPRDDGDEADAERSDEESEDAEPKDEAKRDAPDTGDAMSRKAINDAVAFIRSLAHMHGRNAEWAEKAVIEAASLSAEEAAEINVIDFVASDVAAVLEKADGRTVNLGGRDVTLSTKDLTVEEAEPDFITRALAVLSNPNVAFLLMIVGIYGMIFEFSNPGTIGPGVIGAICLLLGLYALNQLPLDYAGLALVVLGVAFMVAEAFTPTFGVLGLGGLAAFTIGSAMLVDTESPAFQLSWWVIGGTAGTSALILIFVLGYLWRAYRRPVHGNLARMVGVEGQVVDWSGDAGHIWIEGERWNARGAPDLTKDETVRVRALDGLTLIVDRSDDDRPPPGEQRSNE